MALRISYYENSSRNTQSALPTTLLPVLSMPSFARWAPACTELRRRERAVEFHRLARWDNVSPPFAGGSPLLPRSCAAAAAALHIRQPARLGISRRVDAHRGVRLWPERAAFDGQVQVSTTDGRVCLVEPAALRAGWPVHPDPLPSCVAHRVSRSVLECVCTVNSKIVRTWPT
mgnify:CR=1 FL=1